MEVEDDVMDEAVAPARGLLWSPGLRSRVGLLRCRELTLSVECEGDLGDTVLSEATGPRGVVQMTHF